MYEWASKKPCNCRLFGRFDGVLTKILLITISLKIGETQGLAVFLQSKREKTKLPFQIVFALLVLAL